MAASSSATQNTSTCDGFKLGGGGPCIFLANLTEGTESSHLQPRVNAVECTASHQDRRPDGATRAALASATAILASPVRSPFHERPGRSARLPTGLPPRLPQSRMHRPLGREQKSRIDRRTQGQPIPRTCGRHSRLWAACGSWVYNFGSYGQHLPFGASRGREPRATLCARKRGPSQSKAGWSAGSAGLVLSVNPTSKVPKPAQYIDATH
jgi:hypothetical protein